MQTSKFYKDFPANNSSGNLFTLFPLRCIDDLLIYFSFIIIIYFKVQINYFKYISIYRYIIRLLSFTYLQHPVEILFLIFT